MSSSSVSVSATLVVGDLREEEGEEDLDAVESAGVGWKANRERRKE